MHEYYFFSDTRKRKRIEKWFMHNLQSTAVLKSFAPVTFTLDGVTYTVRYLKESEKVYCKRLYGGTVKPYHFTTINKIEKFLNTIRNER